MCITVLVAVGFLQPVGCGEGGARDAAAVVPDGVAAVAAAAM